MGKFYDSTYCHLLMIHYLLSVNICTYRKHVFKIVEVNVSEFPENVYFVLHIDVCNRLKATQ